jgi:hypothetical protein
MFCLQRRSPNFALMKKTPDREFQSACYSEFSAVSDHHRLSWRF